MATTNRAASVIIKSKFVLPNTGTFQTYIEYVDRDETKRNEKYEYYSGYSKKNIEIQRSKQEKIIGDKEKQINKWKETILKEKENVEKLESLNEKFNSYDDYFDDLNSIKNLFSFKSKLFKREEKKELNDFYNKLIRTSKVYLNDLFVEDEVLEICAKQVKKYIEPKQQKINDTLNKKQNYINSLEKKINNEVDKIEKLSERLQNFDSYMDYMGNPDKTSSLFTMNTNQLDENEKKDVKKIFQDAHDKGSIMWQDVISFDNKWLEEHGVYDSKSHTVDETKMKDVVRLAMNEMLKKEKKQDNTFWSAAIHYNTDNIHVHIATVEPEPTTERGKRKLKSLEAMKSKVINNIMDRSQEQKKINDLIRKNIVDSKKNDKILSFKNRAFKSEFLSIYKELPSDRKQWSYGYNSLAHVKPRIDKLSKEYIEKYHKEDFKKLLDKLEKEVEVFKKTYGTGDKKRYEDYKENKVNELYKRLGNAFLQEIKEYDKKQQALLNFSEKKLSKKEKFRKNTSFQQMKYGIDRMLNSEYNKWKNQMAYAQLQQQIEMER